jgi:hypothetical protein
MAIPVAKCKNENLFTKDFKKRGVFSGKSKKKAARRNDKVYGMSSI